MTWVLLQEFFPPSGELDHLWGDLPNTKPLSTRNCFDPTLSVVIDCYTWHGFNCRSFYKNITFGPLLKVAMSKKMHAVVARSTFPSQNVQSTTCSDQFWKFSRRRSARRCAAKHMSKAKCTKHRIFGPLLEVRMSKKCSTPLWCEAHL